MNRDALIIGAALVIGAMYFLVVHEFEHQLPDERVVNFHQRMVDAYNEAEGTEHEYAKLVVVKDDWGPVIARANSDSWRITFRPGLENMSDSVLHDTVAHETAHLMTDTEHEDGHGPEWRRVYERLLAYTNDRH